MNLNAVNERSDFKNFEDVIHKSKVLANYIREQAVGDNKAKEFARDLIVSIVSFERYKEEKLK